ncbi:MAG: DUF302 domain-containing protein [Filomicrobium sp.]
MRIFVVLLSLIMMATTAAATDVKTYTVSGTIDDVAFEVESAIVNRGLVIDMKGDVAGMLKRTGEDVGAAKDVYAGAKYFAFCSAVHSRKMMEADAANMGYCPYIVFVYEAKAAPGKIVVGYRRLSGGGTSDAGKAALNDVDKWLDGIVREVAGG